jgi:hypothetical protein
MKVQSRPCWKALNQAVSDASLSERASSCPAYDFARSPARIAP